MISIQHVSVQLQGREILKDISLAIPKGRVVMLLGENGSGKTTLIRSLLQYIPYQGTIYHAQTDVHTLKQRDLAALFSYVPQIKETVEDQPVEECIVSGFARQLSLFALPSKKQYEQVDALLEAWKLTHIKGKLLQEISGGELQMTYMARAFLQDSALMVMDEPCTYLDYRRQHQFLQEVLRLKLQGRSMLISMHDPNLALQYADELVLLHQGKLHAHIRGTRPEMTAACCMYYNELYGDTFTVIGTESEPTLIWKENNYADDSAIPQGKESR
ncbi:ABC transporter ATP-binding protein [[Clostridium] innocuum]|nr:ABC transporter ATP-binding protein [[Clostridium] innocuum]MCR0578770.1 ABC transporter ATP-binding protein [[Clostridium] innocuum]